MIVLSDRDGADEPEFPYTDGVKTGLKMVEMSYQVIEMVPMRWNFVLSSHLQSIEAKMKLDLKFN